MHTDLHTIVLRYATTELNPADVLSRGIRADQLQNHDLWWHSPHSSRCQMPRYGHLSLRLASTRM